MDPRYIVTASNDMPWQPCKAAKGVSTKPLGTVNGWTMELYRFEPHTSYPDHLHEGPEFVYMIEGEVVRDGTLLAEGYGSAGETGTIDKNFKSGPEGCLFLSVFSTSRLLEG